MAYIELEKIFALFKKLCNFVHCISHNNRARARARARARKFSYIQGEIVMLDHEKLDVYRVSIEFLGIAFQIISQFPQGYGFLSEQLKRASLSIPLNIAEGNGKFNQPDRLKFFKIARGSANECGAILDACKTISILESPLFSKGKEIIERIVCMLSKMIL